MKVKLLLLSFLFFILSVTTVKASNNTPVKNPGFEEGSSPSISSWITHAWENNPGTADFILDGSEARSGSKSALIISNIATDARFKQEIKAKANTYYKLSCWIKTENIGAEAKGANISVDGITDTSLDIRGTNNWQQVELYGKTDKKQKSFTITLGIGGYGSLNTGKAWFDDVSVEELSKLPEGKQSVNLYVPSEKQKGSSPAAFSLLAVIILSALGGLLFISRKPSNPKKLKGFKPEASCPPVFKFKPDKKDVLIMAAMTAVYIAIALFNLGSLKVPQTAWTSEKSGDSFTVDFGREVDLEKVYYYAGLGDGKFKVDYFDKSGNISSLLTEDKATIFNWKSINAAAKTEKLKFTFEAPGITINEIAFVEKGQQRPVKGFEILESVSGNTNPVDVSALFDEQDYFSYIPSYMTGMYFDEIYHARTAFEHIHKLQPYEWTHPPLGKLIISIGILIFGMNPFGWRIMGMLFGAAMIPLMYLFGKKLFEKRFYAFCTAFLMMFDFMHFTQTRIATIDVYGTFFIIVMYYYMYDYFVTKSYATGFKQSLKPLFLSGLFFGIGVASKWISAYGGAGLALLFFLSRGIEIFDCHKAKKLNSSNRPDWCKNFFKLNIIATLLCCLVFFVAIPAIIYYISYIPYMQVYPDKSGLKLVLDYQVEMYNYHSKLVATHAFSSPWYEWPLIYKPTWFYSGSGLPQGRASTIATMGNPAIWWIGTAAIVMSAVISIKKRDKKMSVVFAAIAFQYLPWVLVGRITWIYHFFSTVPFMILAIVYMIKTFTEEYKNFKKIAYVYLGIAAALFIWFYPALSGFEVSKTYIDSLRWFTSWIF